MKALTYALTVIGIRLRPLLWPAMLLLLAAAMLGCSGAGRVSGPLTYASPASIGKVADGRVSVSLDALTIGPGGRARNAGWDQYRLTVRNLDAGTIRIDQVLIIDAFNQGIPPLQSRERLVRNSGDVPGRRDSAAAFGLPLVAYASARTGVARGIDGRELSAPMQQRAVPLPFDLRSEEEVSLDLYFPAVPAPRKLVVVYRCADVMRHVVIDIGRVLNGLRFAHALHPNRWRQGHATRT